MRWSALLFDMGTTGRAVVRLRGRYWEILASPVSTTYLMPGMVIEVSATFVATTIFLPGSRLKTRDCSPAESRP